MYNQLKSIARNLLPTAFLKANEERFRRLVALRYAGSTYRCNVCGTGLSTFVRLERGDLLCPRCGSLPRGRRLWHVLSEEMEVRGLKVLHFSPSASVAGKLREYPLAEYVTTDFEGEFTADKSYDITAIDEPDGRFDLIICYHVLEHIPDDAAAMQELHRVLAPGGLCLIQTPFREGDIYEDASIATAADRLAAFGQEDHVRVYSVAGLTDRLRKAGFRVAGITYPPNHLHGWRGGETVLYAEKK
ncbi:class I SAM-dependent methyltransferase [Neolewinella persica]|uniref:class I SAM-dependent methyltransferase n=1 Tax=Neolewinella persica TaxID=70998 RepID=UPI000370E93E|nr:class I SAM-dependent methyltransferase [Neolewinella persica]